ncbi:ATP-binding cassette domain-containing protein [Streptomyces sp. NPDC021622]|uniref:ATP-binding cassette domain-containing protein n=1 Tax=Streptomyces sp. NPDC021622 TaxID=3155013 RepID=UPI0033D668ED
MGDPHPKLEAHAVTRTFGRGAKAVAALGPVDLRIAPGEFTCIVGPSGCGKSTLLRIAAGLLKPSRGELKIRTTAQRPAAMIFQDYGIYDWKTVQANVRFGLDVHLKVLPTPDALPLLAKGDIDAQWAAPEAAVMNGITSGFTIKWAAGNFSPDPQSKSGLWVKLKKGEHADHVPMAGRKLGTMIGKGSVISYPMGKALKKHGGGLDKIQFQQLGSADVLTALQNGGTDSAWLLDPVWRKVDGDKRYAFLGGQPQGEPLGGLLFGPDLLTEDPDAGVALLRAYIRTVNTYFAGDYKADKAFVSELAKLLKTDEAVLRSTPSLRMDWEIRSGTTDRLQDAYEAAGVTEGDKVPEEKAVDRKLYGEAVGHK